MYVAVYEQYEEFGEIDRSSKFVDHEYTTLCRSVLRKAGIQNERSDPTRTVRVLVYEIVAKSGKMVRQLAKTLDVSPDVKYMTIEEYNTQIISIMNEIPEEFHNFVRSTAWNVGGSSGYEEVIMYAEDLIYGLQEPIKQYTDRIKNNDH